MGSWGGISVLQFGLLTTSRRLGSAAARRVPANPSVEQRSHNRQLAPLRLSISGRATSMGREKMFTGRSESQLKEWLETAGVSTVNWGQGAAKSVALLWTEVQDGESSLALDGDGGRPLRVVQVLNVTLRNARGQVLIEAAQVLPTGSRRERDVVVSEKMLPGESWEEAAERAIKEELGPVLPPQPQISIERESYQQEIETRESQSYTGLMSKYICHRCTAAVAGLPEENFTTQEPRPDGTLTHIWEWR